jgi:ethanolamine utilization protein EutN
MSWSSARMASSTSPCGVAGPLIRELNMILGKVVGTVVTTISHPDFKNRRLLVVQPLNLEGESADEDFIALDNTQAGIGDTVLVNREGNGARQVLKNPNACVISVIVGIVDSVFIAK